MTNARMRTLRVTLEQKLPVIDLKRVEVAGDTSSGYLLSGHGGMACVKVPGLDGHE